MGDGKNILLMVISIVSCIISLYGVWKGVELLLHTRWTEVEKLLIGLCLVAHVVYVVFVMICDLGSKETWSGLVACVKIGFYIALSILALLLVLDFCFLVYLLMQKLDENIVLFIIFTLIMAGGILVVALVYVGISLPVFSLYASSSRPSHLSQQYPYISLAQPSGPDNL